MSLLVAESPIAEPVGEQYERFDNVEARNSLQLRIEIPLLLRALRPPLGRRVLEIGCGRGIALPVLAERLRPAALFGVDIDPALVAIARQRTRAMGIDAVVMEGDVRDLPFEDGTFELVIDFGTCYHVSGGSHGARTALSEVARVLRSDGLFIEETPIAQHLAHPVRSFARRLPWAAQPDLRPERRAMLWSMRRKTRDAASAVSSRLAVEISGR
jgi:SAM-dependent methyltransferase